MARTMLELLGEQRDHISRVERRQIRNGQRGYPGDIGITIALTPPPGALPLDGQSLLRSEYPRLFKRIGTYYGAADALHFNLPDMRGRTLAHLGSGQFGSIGNLIGAENVAISVAQMPSHNHNGSTGSEVVTADFATNNAATNPDGTARVVRAGTVNQANRAIQTSGHSHTIPSQGGGQAHNNVQPTIVFIVYVWP